MQYQINFKRIFESMFRALTNSRISLAKPLPLLRPIKYAFSRETASASVSAPFPTSQ